MQEENQSAILELRYIESHEMQVIPRKSLAKKVIYKQNFVGINSSKNSLTKKKKKSR